FPILGMNAFATAWGAILPLQWYMAVLLGQAARGLPPADSAPAFAALAALTALYALLAFLRLRSLAKSPGPAPAAPQLPAASAAPSWPSGGACWRCAAPSSC